MIIQLLYIVLGFALLGLSSKQTMRRLVKLAHHFGMPELSISFVVVGLASILPELSVGVSAALNNIPNFGLGIIFGSNIADMTLLIGIVAIMHNGVTLRNSTIKQLRWFLLAVVLPVFLLFDGSLSRFDGLILIAAFAVYLFKIFTLVPKSKKIRVDDIKLRHEIPLLITSLALLLFSGHWISESAKEIGTILGIPVMFLGVILALGTCLPELSVALRSIKDKHGELGIGAVLGNVCADSLLTLGVIALINPIIPKQPQFAFFAGIFMILSMMVLITLFKKNHKISKIQGIMLILMYVVFLLAQSLLETTIAI